MGTLHAYRADVVWTGAGAVGTAGYAAYSRDHEVRIAGKPALPGSSDPAFRGDPARFTPEELLVAALAQCHMLWFLHLAAAAGVVVLAYTDHARGTMLVEGAGHGQFTEVVLQPFVTLALGARTPGGDPVDDAHLEALHLRAHESCFVARSVNFPVRCEPAAHTTDASPAVTAADG
ncbi:MAG TPA: OsmC family protein [Cellulomonas sp.]|uniref:OsmC family protein n=1 Tax=Cellulomonas sp. TaxID=40001 RepID=UPI002E35ED15|nr:OsmC family protein [Cellulomonas sp.]HEX5331868.1 OsmC family protein [Cellulomonas sp.]